MAALTASGVSVKTGETIPSSDLLEGLKPDIRKVPLEIQAKILSFLPTEKSELAVQDNRELLTPIFSCSILPDENRRGAFLANYIIERLFLSSEASKVSDETIQALTALRDKPQGKVLLYPLPTDCETPLALARAHFRSGWINAIAKACEGLESIETLKSLVDDPKVDMSPLNRSQLCQIVHRVAMRIIKQDPSQRAPLVRCQEASQAFIEGHVDEALGKALIKAAESNNFYQTVIAWQNGPISTSALRSALLGAAENGHGDIVKLLFQSRDIPIDYRRQAFLGAAANGHGDIVKLLFQSRDIPIDYRRQAFLGAAANGHGDIVKLLIERGGMYLFRGEAAQTAAAKGHTAIVELLLQNGDISECYRGEAIRRAAPKGHKEVIELLLQSGDIPEYDRREAVRRAAAKGHATIVGLLLQNGDISEKDHRGEVVKSAAMNGHNAIAELLSHKRFKLRALRTLATATGFVGMAAIAVKAYAPYCTTVIEGSFSSSSQEVPGLVCDVVRATNTYLAGQIASVALGLIAAAGSAIYFRNKR